jgi:alanyl-tRNA synthetase
MMTDRLYYEDSYQTRFQARVVSCNTTEAGPVVYLDRTFFYPTSGGQPADRGWIAEIAVEDVFEDEQGLVGHQLNRPVPPGPVECRIDWDRRFDHMQQHTGQHILSQAFVKMAQLQTVGFHMGEDYATIDLEGANLSLDTLQKVEELANAIIFENRPVTTRTVPAAEAAAAGLRKESKRAGDLRIVEVAGFDLSACGGTHVRATGEIGALFIRRLERVNRQIRIEFLCGRRSLRSYREVVRTLDQAARKFSSSWNEVPGRIEKVTEESRNLHKTLQEKNRLLAQLQTAALYSSAPVLDAGYRLVRQVFRGEEIDYLKTLAQSLSLQGPCVALFANEGEQVQLVFAGHASLPFDLRASMSAACRILDGKGGGTRTFVQGGGKNRSNLQAALDAAEAALHA